MNGIFKLTDALRPAFIAACLQEHVFGSKIVTALAAFGLDNPQQEFFLVREDGQSAAMNLSGGVLLIASGENFFSQALAPWITGHKLAEIDCRFPLCEKLREQLGGAMESSYFMEYLAQTPPQGDFTGVAPTRDLAAVFSVLQQSHDYYRAHLHFDSWSAELSEKLSLGLMELVLVYEDGRPVATGSIVSQDAEAAAVAAVAVIPKARHRGLGARVSGYLTARILSSGKRPVLISGYDEVAELYRQIGYTPCGRWGELYL